MIEEWKSVFSDSGFLGVGGECNVYNGYKLVILSKKRDEIGLSLLALAHIH